MRAFLAIQLTLLPAIFGCGSDDSGGGTGGGTGSISGRLLDGGGLPVQLSCVVSTYYASLVDPNAPDFDAKRARTESVIVEAWPQAYTLADVTAGGPQWYVAGRCDTDGDGTWDIGGWYPGPTPAPVQAPRTDVDITILP